MTARFVVAVLAVSVISTAADASGFDTKRLGQFGTVDLAHVRAWKQSPRLRKEIEAELAKTGKTPGDVDCLGRRFPGTWGPLGGERAPPFVCHFGTKDLHLNWTVTLVSRTGRRFVRPTPAAMREADDLLQTNPVWHWAPPDENAEP